MPQLTVKPGIKGSTAKSHQMINSLDMIIEMKEEWGKEGRGLIIAIPTSIKEDEEDAEANKEVKAEVVDMTIGPFARTSLLTRSTRDEVEQLFAMQDWRNNESFISQLFAKTVQSMAADEKGELISMQEIKTFRKVVGVREFGIKDWCVVSASRPGTLIEDSDFDLLVRLDALSKEMRAKVKAEAFTIKPEEK